MKSSGSWRRLFRPEEPAVLRLDRPWNIHQVQRYLVHTFYGMFLCRPESFFRFNELEKFQKEFGGMILALEREAELGRDPEVARWVSAFRAFVSEVQVLNLDAYGALSKGTPRDQYEETRTKAMAVACRPVLEGYGEPEDERFPLNEQRDPDTNWERWAAFIDPVERWAFHRRFFMVSTKHKVAGGGQVGISMPSFFTNPELYARKRDTRWHPIWGFTLYGRFLPHLERGEHVLAEELDDAEALDGRLPFLARLCAHRTPAVRARAYYSIGDRIPRETSPETVEKVVHALETGIADERDREAVRCLSAGISRAAEWSGLGGHRERLKAAAQARLVSDGGQRRET